MKSYSKVFKASHLSLMGEVKVVNQPYIPTNLPKDEIDEIESIDQEDLETLSYNAQQLIQETEASALAIKEEAEQTAHLLISSAEEKISTWWEENHARLETMTVEAKQQGYQEGYAQGSEEGQEAVRKEYQQKIEQSQQLLQEAYTQKVAIISEAEPFLLELSTAIAEQILKQELTVHPDKFVELIKQHILRFKEKDFITVCVHPEDFTFIQSQRAHLVAVVNGETEIKIIPDHSVSPKGCIIRTAYGSIDARIDTQIEEIKKAILEIRREPNDGIISG